MGRLLFLVPAWFRGFQGVNLWRNYWVVQRMGHTQIWVRNWIADVVWRIWFLDMKETDLAAQVERMRESRRAERVVKLHWLRAQRKLLRKLVREMDAEVRALEGELVDDRHEEIFFRGSCAGDNAAAAG